MKRFFANLVVCFLLQMSSLMRVFVFSSTANYYNGIKSKYHQLKLTYNNNNNNDEIKLDTSLKFINVFNKSLPFLYKQMIGGDRYFRDVYKVYINVAKMYNRQNKPKHALDMLHQLKSLKWQVH